MRLVAIGTLPPPHNGQSVAFEEFLGALMSDGIALTVLRLPAFRTRTGCSKWAAWGYMLFFLRLVCSLVHCTTVYLQLGQSTRGMYRDLLVLEMCQIFRRSVVCHLHGGNYRESFDRLPAHLRQRLKKRLSLCKAIILLDRSIVSSFPLLPGEGAIRFISNGIALPPDVSRAPKTLPGRQCGAVKLLYCSSLIETKGYLEAIHATGMLHRRYGWDVELDICGAYQSTPDAIRVRSEVECHQAIESAIRVWNVEDRIRVLGTVTGHDKLQHYQQAHFLLLPSRYIYEGQPLCLIEALAFGTVPVATAFRAIPGLISHGSTGLLLDSVAPGEIAFQLDQVLQQPEWYSRMSAASMKRFDAEFTLSHHTTQIIRLLTEDD